MGPSRQCVNETPQPIVRPVPKLAGPRRSERKGRARVIIEYPRLRARKSYHVLEATARHSESQGDDIPLFGTYGNPLLYIA